MKLIENMPIPMLRAIAAAVSSTGMARKIINLRHRRWTGRGINWSNPATLQEYVFTTLFDAASDTARLRLYADLADKVKVREYAASRCPGLRMPELLGCWESAQDIDWESLPQKFAMKTNNGCGTNLIVRDKNTLDLREATKKLSRWIKFPYGTLSGQIHYSRIRPMIFAEALLEPRDGKGELPLDYKFFCFNGEPRFILFYEGRTVNGHITPNMAFNLEWEPIPGAVLRPIGHDIEAPASLRQMTDCARALSQGLPFARVDFYDIDGEAVLGEITLTPDVTANFTEEFLRKVMAEYVR